MASLAETNISRKWGQVSYGPLTVDFDTNEFLAWGETFALSKRSDSFHGQLLAIFMNAANTRPDGYFSLDYLSRLLSAQNNSRPKIQQTRRYIGSFEIASGVMASSLLLTDRKKGRKRPYRLNKELIEAINRHGFNVPRNILNVIRIEPYLIEAEPRPTEKPRPKNPMPSFENIQRYGPLSVNIMKGIFTVGEIAIEVGYARAHIISMFLEQAQKDNPRLSFRMFEERMGLKKDKVQQNMTIIKNKILRHVEIADGVTADSLFLNDIIRQGRTRYEVENNLERRPHYLNRELVSLIKRYGRNIPQEELAQVRLDTVKDVSSYQVAVFRKCLAPSV